MKIRRYKEKDEKQIKELVHKTLTEIFGKTRIKKWEDFKNYTIVYIAEDDGKIVGTIALIDEEGGNGRLKRMYVNKNYRKKGMGQKLFDKIMEFAIKNKFKRIFLSSYSKMKKAIKFYKKNGFKEMKEVNLEKDFAYLKNRDVADRIFMEKFLK